MLLTMLVKGVLALIQVVRGCEWQGRCGSRELSSKRWMGVLALSWRGGKQEIGVWSSQVLRYICPGVDTKQASKTGVILWARELSTAWSTERGSSDIGYAGWTLWFRGVSYRPVAQE